jgi:hypothetical protein
MSVVLATWESEIRPAVQSQLRQIVQDTYLENTQPKSGLESGSSGRVPALQV